jgi:hypothetical protein
MPIFGLVKRGHCGVASEPPQTANHMSQQCLPSISSRKTQPVYQPKSKTGTLRGCVRTASNSESHVAAVSPFYAAHRHSAHFRIKLPRSFRLVKRSQSINPKVKRGHCGVASEPPQTANHMSQRCPRFTLLTATVPIFRIKLPHPFRLVKRRQSISPKVKRGHCGAASEPPQTANHMSQQCPRFTPLTATVPIFRIKLPHPFRLVKFKVKRSCP